MDKNKKVVPATKRKTIFTVFLLLFPSFIVTAIACFNATILLSVISIGLFFFQAVLIQNFVKDHYVAFEEENEDCISKDTEE